MRRYTIKTILHVDIKFSALVQSQRRKKGNARVDVACSILNRIWESAPAYPEEYDLCNLSDGL